MDSFLQKLGLRIALILCSSIGAWHALPLVNVIADEMYYVGGVFRALEAHSIFPLAGDVPYGTLTFYCNYLLQLPLIAGLFVWTGFHLEALKELLIIHPEVAYGIPRLVSIGIACTFGWFLNRFLKDEGFNASSRTLTLTALFCTVLPAVIFHTGKMWVLSFVLVTISLLYAYRALTAPNGGREQSRAIYLSVVPAFLATANVLFAGLSLGILLVFAYVFRLQAERLRTLLKATLLGVGVFVFFLLVNFHNVVSLVALVLNQYDALPDAARLGILASLALHSFQVGAAFPLVLAALCAGLIFGTIRNPVLLRLSAAYALVYFIFIVFTATWYADTSAYWRYMFPFTFFFSLMLGSISYAGFLKRVIPAFITVQLGVYAYLLFLLATPTTLNQAREHLIQTYGRTQVTVYDEGQVTELPLNTESALALKQEFCGSKCQYLKMHPDASSFVPLVLGAQSVIPNPLPDGRVVVVRTKREAPACAKDPIATFLSGARDDRFVSIEHNLGNYFLPDFWHLRRLGPNIYLYEVDVGCLKLMSAP